MFYHIFLGNFRHSLSADNPEDFFCSMYALCSGGAFLMTDINFENRSFRSMRRSENDWMRGISKYVCNFELKYVTFYKKHSGQPLSSPRTAAGKPSWTGETFLTSFTKQLWPVFQYPRQSLEIPRTSQVPTPHFCCLLMNSLGWKTKKCRIL